MANIRNRNGRWQAQVCRKGSDTLTKTFPTRKDALAWARAQEHQIDDGRTIVRPKVTKATLGELLDRYRSSVTPTKKSAEVEGYRIGKLLRHPLSALPATKITTTDIVRYRDDRLADVSSETVRQDLVLLRQVFDVARREWGHSIICNPVDDVTWLSCGRTEDWKVCEVWMRQRDIEVTPTGREGVYWMAASLDAMLR